MYRHRRIAVVVPAYNEELLIGETLSSLPSYVDKIYAVDDYSKDKTSDIILAFAFKDNRIMHIRHKENKGVGAAITSGYKQALSDGMDIVSVMAGDNQMDPNYLTRFLDPIIDGKADYTKGNRLITPGYRTGMSTWRFIGNSVLTFLTKLSSGYWHVIDPQNGYTAISRECLENLDLDSLYPRYGYCNNILTKMNVNDFRIMNISHPAKYGLEKSKIRYSSYILRVSRLLLFDFLWRLKNKYIIRDFHPLVLFYFAGAILMTLGMFGAAYSLYYRLMQSGPLFDKDFLSLTTFIFGVQFFLFAMLFDRIEDRKQYSLNPESPTVEASSKIAVSTQKISIDQTAELHKTSPGMVLVSASQSSDRSAINENLYKI
ncbi:MAG: glycosyltransferase family 2 protein [Methanotrichaceae archaeon]|nr:glycosyltransferase family 2 protein [Methanotrichaceae archaeon]